MGFKNTMRPTGAMAECMWTIQGLETMEPIIVSLGSPYLLYDMPWAETLPERLLFQPAHPPGRRARLVR